jgi:hypothetical protein
LEVLCQHQAAAAQLRGAADVVVTAAPHPVCVCVCVCVCACVCRAWAQRPLTDRPAPSLRRARLLLRCSATRAAVVAWHSGLLLVPSHTSAHALHCRAAAAPWLKACLRAGRP